MVVVSVSLLRKRLGAYLALVKQGEEVVVTKRGVPIAIIRPILEA